MSARVCIRGCTVRGEHFAKCADYGRDDGACSGCVPAEALNHALICRRCSNRLRQRLDRAPELVEYIRLMTRTVSTVRYDRIRGSNDRSAVAPIHSDFLDAQRDIMATIWGGSIPAAASVGAVKMQAIQGVRHIFEHFDSLINDAESIAEWWQVVVAHEVPGAPEFWTISRALARWPLEERRHWTAMPCPGCNLRTVKVTPPPRAGALAWYTCASCAWERSDVDDAGRWAEKVDAAAIVSDAVVGGAQ